MSLVEQLIQLKENLNTMARKHTKVQTAWAKVKTVDWANKRMVATGVADNLDYNDVLLGLTSYVRKPVAGTLCLLGIIENQEAATFLIYAEEVEETVFNGGENGGIPIAGKVVDNDNAIKNYLDNLNNAISAGLEAVGLGTAASGTAGKAAFELAMATQEIVFEDIENLKIKH